MRVLLKPLRSCITTHRHCELRTGRSPALRDHQDEEGCSGSVFSCHRRLSSYDATHMFEDRRRNAERHTGVR